MSGPLTRFLYRRRREWEKFRGYLMRKLVTPVLRWRLLRREGVAAAEELVIFIIPATDFCNGGLMSIAAIAAASRRLLHGVPVLNAIHPLLPQGAWVNPTFPNRERFVRFSKICRIAHPRKLTLHVPDRCVEDFPASLSAGGRDWLRRSPELRINVLNQNVEKLPPPERWQGLLGLGGAVSQTTAHRRYATQEICDRFGVPLLHLSTCSDHTGWPQLPFDRKERTIVISPDLNEGRAAVLEALSRRLPEYRIVEVRDMTFTRYLELISKSLFTITFGEGFDGYFCQPAACGSLGFAVYNSRFFPSVEWKSCRNVYESYADMERRLPSDLARLAADADEYEAVRRHQLALISGLRDYQSFGENLRRFYNGEYDFLPHGKCGIIRKNEQGPR